MVEIETKYFGKIIFDETKKSDIISVKYGRSILNIGLPCCFINNKETLNSCIEIMNKYKKINRIAKREIKNIAVNEENIVKHFFKYHFDNYEKEKINTIFNINIFEKVDLNKIIKIMKCSDFLFQTGEDDNGDDDNNKITFWINYMISKEHFSETLCIRMDNEFNIIEVDHFNKKNYKNSIRRNFT